MAITASGHVALVTGANQGIGAATAIALGRRGAAVLVAYFRPGDDAGQPAEYNRLRRGDATDVVAEIERAGGRAWAVEADLRDPASPALLFDAAEDRLGPVDILVNNAAGGGFRPFLEWTDAQIATVLELNFWSCWHLIRRVLPGMLERHKGWILNVSSQTATMPIGPPFPPTQPARIGTIYGGTKAFLNRWTASLAVELYGQGIAVNTIAPQAAAATEALVTFSDLPDYLYEPLETMAEGALALCTADAASLTGQITTSLQLLADLQRPVYDLRGVQLLKDWQPEQLPPRIEKMRQHAAGEIAYGPTGVERVTNADGVPSR
jgi:NAD(P)-dependent dehydrogenase (short-subunit alcohol dehydrogenase family)